MLAHQPGQYAAFSFSRKYRPTPARCFSIVSSPTEQGVLQFSMRVRGHFTRAVDGLQKGDIVKVRGPFGGFVLDASRDRDVVLLAGGIGITPFMSMVRYAASIHSTSKIALVYSCASQEDVPFGGELVNLQKQNPNFRVIFVISDGPTNKLTGQLVAKGRISPEVIEAASGNTHEGKTYFICGPPPFMKGMIQTLRGKGVGFDQIRTEAFGQGSNRQTGKIRSWPYNIYALSAVGVTLGSFTVMVSDLLKVLPPSTIANQSNSVTTKVLTNKRQQDLSKLVNALPDLNSGAPVSDAVTQAEAAVAAATAANNAATSNPTTKTTTPTTTTPKTTTPTVTTPAPAPTPKCTTSASGVTTCK